MKTLRPLYRHFLDFDKTISFFKSQVDGGTTLSKILLERVDFSKGQFFTLLPKEANLNRLYDFQVGGILPQNPISEIYIESLETSFPGRWVNSIESELVFFIKNHLKENSSRCFLFEDVLREISDKKLKILQSQIVSFKKEFYYKIFDSTDEVIIQQILSNANALWHMLGICFEATGLKKGQLLLQDLEMICAGVFSMLIRAYDGEGYLFWEK